MNENEKNKVENKDSEGVLDIKTNNYEGNRNKTVIPGKISSFNSKSPVFLKSPPNVILSRVNSGNLSSTNNSHSRPGSFTIYGKVASTPKKYKNNEDSDFESKLGPRRSNTKKNMKVLSPCILSSNKKNLPEENTQKYHFVNSRDSNRKTYKSKNFEEIYSDDEIEINESNESGEGIGKTENSEIKKLKEQLENQNALLNAFLKKEKDKKEENDEMNDKQRESQSKKSYTKTSKAKYETPVPESPEEETKKSNMPDYENMDEEETLVYEAKFIVLFNTLIDKYERWGFKIPDIGKISLSTVHEIYDEYVDAILIYQLAMKFKVYLVLSFAALEYYCFFHKKIKAFKNFTKTQIKTINKYHSYLMNFAKTIHQSGGNEWSNSFKFITDVLTSVVSFVTIQGAGNAFGKNVPESMLHEMTQFFAPTDGPVTLKPDGLRPVPAKPEKWQEPSYIIENGVKLYNSAEGMLNMGSTVNKPSVAKPIDASKYADVFE